MRLRKTRGRDREPPPRRRPSRPRRTSRAMRASGPGCTSTRSRPSSSTCAGAAAPRASAIPSHRRGGRARDDAPLHREHGEIKDGDLAARRRRLRGRLLHRRHHADVPGVRAVHARPQRALYEIVLEAQLAAIDACRPGRTMQDVHDVATRVLVDGMVRVGLLRGGARRPDQGQQARAVLHAQDEPLARTRRPRRRPLRAARARRARSSPTTC